MIDKVVYVLTSSGKDFFSVMTRVSIATIRLSNPNIEICLFCDSLSYSLLLVCKDEILQEVNEIISINTPDGDAVFRNRYIKTNLRNYLDGNFLFLDSDIVVRGDISEIFKLDCDIAGARNHSKEKINEQIWSEDRENFEALGWSVGSDYYINGGVLYYNDTPKARSFAQKWHQKWLENVNKTGRNRDQPALNSAIYDLKLKVYVLDNSYNSQFVMEVSAITDAKIWHYYSSANCPRCTEFEYYVNTVMACGKIEKKSIEKIVIYNYPWRNEILLDRLVAKRIERNNQLYIFDKLWLDGKRIKAVNNLIVTFIKKLKKTTRKIKK